VIPREGVESPHGSAMIQLLLLKVIPREGVERQEVLDEGFGLDR